MRSSSRMCGTMVRWREELRPVTDRYLDDLARTFPNARAAYDKFS